MNKIIGIYKIQSIIRPDRFYIGSSVNIIKRWNHHLNDLRNGIHHSAKLQRHFNKYGESDIQFIILLGCEIDDLIKTEQYFLDSYKPYFNCCFVAGTCAKLKRSRETIEKQRKKMIGKKWTIEQRERFSKQRKGIPKSEEHKKSLSKALKGKPGKRPSDEAILRMSKDRIGSGNPMFGKIPWNKKVCQN